MSRWVNVPDIDTNAVKVGQETFARHLVASNTVATGTGNLRLTFFTSRKTEVATKIRLHTGATPASATPTLVRAGIYSAATNGDLSLVASTVNATSTLAAPGTGYEIALQASCQMVTGQRYALGILIVTAVTAPQMMGNNILLSTEAATTSPRLCGLLPSQADLPSSITDASLVISANMAYSVVLP